MEIKIINDRTERELIEDLLEKQDYFNSFMKTAIKDLSKTKSAFVFSEEQVNYLKEVFTDLVVENRDGIYYLTISEYNYNIDFPKVKTI